MRSPRFTKARCRPPRSTGCRRYSRHSSANHVDRRDAQVYRQVDTFGEHSRHLARRGGNVAIYLSSSYRVQSSSRILSACGWYLLTVARGPMTIARHPYTGSGITFIAPHLRRLAILVNVGNPQSVLEMGAAQAAARMLGLEVATFEFRRSEDIVPA